MQGLQVRGGIADFQLIVAAHDLCDLEGPNPPHNDPTLGLTADLDLSQVDNAGIDGQGRFNLYRQGTRTLGVAWLFVLSQMSVNHLPTGASVRSWAETW